MSRGSDAIPRPATLSDVARVAGVAVSTASRALSNPGRVSGVTRRRIEQAAAELNYVANSSARALSSGFTGAVAVLVPDITNPFYFDIIRGTQRQLTESGYTQLLVDTEESVELEATLLAKLQQSCDGVILAAPRLSDARLAAINQAIPLVTINRPRGGLGSVLIDTAGGVVLAMDHLASLNHARVVYVSGPQASWSSERRWCSIQQAAARLDVAVTRTRPFSPMTTSGPPAADAVLETGATACITFNDLIAIGMLERFRERGVRVPADVSIVGCDDIFGASFCHPPLTTLTAPIEQAGRVAVSMLLAGLPPGAAPRKRGDAGSSIVLPTHLTVRHTTAARPLRHAGPDQAAG